MAFAPVHLSVCVRGVTSWNGRCLNLKLFIFYHLYQKPCDSSLVALILQKEVQKSCQGCIILIKTRLREMLSFIIPSTKSQPRFWWGKTGQISGYSPGSQFPILLVQSLLEAPLSQTDLTSSPIWTLHFHKCHNNEAGDEVFKVSSLIISVFIRTVSCVGFWPFMGWNKICLFFFSGCYKFNVTYFCKHVLHIHLYISYNIFIVAAKFIFFHR